MIGLDTTPSIYDVLNNRGPRVIGEKVEIDADTFNYFLNILPPVYVRDGFQMGEADCYQDGRTVRSQFTEIAGKHFHQWAYSTTVLNAPY